MKYVLLSRLRDKTITIKEFRENSEKLGFILATEAGNYLDKEPLDIRTPIDQAHGWKFKNNIVIIPILRAALSLLPSFLKFFEYANVGFMGLARDENTAIARIYYKKFPKIKNNDDVIILDPMIATGGSAIQVISNLKKLGIKEEKIIFISIICYKLGIDKLKITFPKIKFIYVKEDKTLNANSFIVPGLGDFGDRFFGTL